jgi:MoxR-like ATPase
MSCRHHELVDGILACLLASGHVLIEGMPRLGKTMSDAMDLEFSRIQFTPDLMPADIIGTQMVMQDEAERRHFQFQRGPVFTQFLLADEINRATAKTQSALVDAMDEKKVTVERESHPLREPFMVLAPQNPIEMEGTYPLPEAQLGRFLLKLDAGYPNAEELSQIIDRSTGKQQPAIHSVLNTEQLLQLRMLAREVVIAQHVKDLAIRIVLVTHPREPGAVQASKRFVRHGASPRGVLVIVLTTKA